MATRSHVQTASDDDIGIPDLNDTSEEYKPAQAKNNSTANIDQDASLHGALTSDDFDEMGFDNARDEKERAKIDPPTGDWEKVDLWKTEKRVQPGNCQQGDIDTAGRTSLNCWGKPKERNVNGMSYEPTLFIRISPDIRYKEEDQTKVDLAYKLFLDVKDTYLSIYGEAPKTMKHLRSMLENDEYLVRTMKGDNGPVTVGVKAKRAKK